MAYGSFLAGIVGCAARGDLQMITQAIATPPVCEACTWFIQ